MNSVGSIIGWRSYATARGNGAPEQASDTDANAALVRARDYISATYPNAIKGSAPEIEQCIYIASSHELGNPGFWAKTWTEGDRKTLTAVGDIKWTHIPGKTVDMALRSTLIEGFLAKYEAKPPTLVYLGAT